MARLFPNRLSARVPREVARAFRKLKKLPDDFSVHHSLTETRDPAGEEPPDFLVFWQAQYGFIIKIAATSQELAESSLQGSLFSSGPTVTPENLGTAENECLRAFCRKLPANFPLRRLLLFPNVSQNTIDTISLQRSKDNEISFLGLNQLGNESLAAHLTALASSSLSKNQSNSVRAIFDPGITLPHSFASIRNIDRQTDPTLTPSLLDLDQEWCVKNQLFLPLENKPREAEAISQTRLVTGVAGSGKSLILLYRAALLSHLKPNLRVLLLTHNKPILNELRRRLRELTPHHHHIQCLTFFQWSHHHLGSWPERTIAEAEIHRILAELDPHPFKISFLADEIGRLKDHSFTKKSHYLEADRSGWGKPLPSKKREAIWNIYRRYQEYLDSHQLIDWHGVAMRFHQEVMSGKLTLLRYDAILIDEAQFFAKAWFDLIRQSLNPQGQLFLAADPTQGFLKRRQSWLASGIEVRGRTTRLTHPYRNTRCILAFAARFFETRRIENPELNPESFNLPTMKQLENIPVKGSPPEIILCPSLQDAHLRAANEITQLRKKALPPGQILILHADSRRLLAFEQTLAKKLGDQSLVHHAREGVMTPGAYCQISTLNAATGLEAPIVFLLGIDTILDRELDPQLSPGEREELHASQTCLLYMAFTRAGQKLIVLSTSPDRVEFFKKLQRQE